MTPAATSSASASFCSRHVSFPRWRMTLNPPVAYVSCAIAHGGPLKVWEGILVVTEPLAFAHSVAGKTQFRPKMEGAARSVARTRPSVRPPASASDGAAPTRQHDSD